MTPTGTFVFAANDVPTFEQVPKGSEKDRSLIIYLPNRYIDKGEVPTSPRTFCKDLGLEKKVASMEFARGHLLNLLQVRMECVANSTPLDELIAEGTPTSRVWLQKWWSIWTGEHPDETQEADKQRCLRLCKFC